LQLAVRAATPLVESEEMERKKTRKNRKEWRDNGLPGSERDSKEMDFPKGRKK